MAKTIRIMTILGCIHYGEEVHVQGGEPFDCEAKEARRLIALGVAALPPEAAPASQPGIDKAELLAAIEAAETTDALIALMPEDEPDEEIAIAFKKRLDELEDDH